METIQTEPRLCSDEYLGDKNCFNKSNVNGSPRRRKAIFFNPVDMKNCVVYFEKEAKLHFEEKLRNIDGPDEDGFKKHGFGTKGFHRNCFNKHGFKIN